MCLRLTHSTRVFPTTIVDTQDHGTTVINTGLEREDRQSKEDESFLAVSVPRFPTPLLLGETLHSGGGDPESPERVELRHTGCFGINPQCWTLNRETVSDRPTDPLLVKGSDLEQKRWLFSPIQNLYLLITNTSYTHDLIYSLKRKNSGKILCLRRCL